MKSEDIIDKFDLYWKDQIKVKLKKRDDVKNKKVLKEIKQFDASDADSLEDGKNYILKN